MNNQDNQKSNKQNMNSTGTQGVALSGTIKSQTPVNAGQASSQQQQTSENTVVGIFSSRPDAERAVNELRSQGFVKDEINIVSRGQQKKDNQSEQTEYYDDDVTDGTLTGGTLGGIGGLILGAGALAIPGVGPIIAAGPIAAALSGAVAGGVAGGLIDWGIPAESSKHYEQSIAQGSIVAIVRTSQAKSSKAETILRQSGAQNVETHQSNTKKDH